jgi:hypothetical protein
MHTTVGIPRDHNGAMEPGQYSTSAPHRRASSASRAWIKRSRATRDLPPTTRIALVGDLRAFLRSSATAVRANTSNEIPWRSNSGSWLRR